MKKALFLLVLIPFFLQNCKTKEKIITNYDTVYKNITITEKLRDTIITINADSSVMKLYWECDSLGNVLITEVERLRSGKPKIAYRTNVKYLTITSKIDVEKLKLFLKDKLIEKYELNKSKFFVTKEIEKKFNLWQKIRLYTGTFVLFASIFLIILFIIKKLK